MNGSGDGGREEVNMIDDFHFLLFYQEVNCKSVLRNKSALSTTQLFTFAQSPRIKRLMV